MRNCPTRSGIFRVRPWKPFKCTGFCKSTSRRCSLVFVGRASECEIKKIKKISNERREQPQFWYRAKNYWRTFQNRSRVTRVKEGADILCGYRYPCYGVLKYSTSRGTRVRRPKYSWFPILLPSKCFSPRTTTSNVITSVWSNTVSCRLSFSNSTPIPN